jgi:signal transduction histidine kinase
LRKALSGVRVKLIAAIALSAGAAALATYALLAAARWLNDLNPLMRGLFGVVRNTAGETTVTVAVGLLLFILAFFLMTRRSVRQIEAIIDAVRQMERGRLDTRVDVAASDEIGELAAAVNGMADRLSASLEEERRSEQAKRELIASMSHDLRTPLTSIIGFLELLTDRSGRTGEELERFASISHKKALRLQGLIDELFEYTRVGYDGVRLNREAINLNELLGQMAEEFYPVFERSGIACRLHIPDARIVAAADGELLHRLMENLLNNAVKYGAEGRFIDLHLGKTENFALIEVVNYGPAIPPEHLPNIFRRFYRAEQSRSRLTGGTGLGLAIAAGIVELHGGAITAESDERSTRFRVSLPVS